MVADDGTADQFVTVPLTATVTDDGVALPLTLTWSQLSGPGTATITNPSAEDTTVSFDTAGTYVLQLEADDTEFQVTDTATFIVAAVNQPPVVTADDGTANTGVSTPLTGTVTDDGVALPLTLTWSQISGPGTATIGDPSAEDTTVTFDAAGTYVMRLVADDTEFIVSDTATFTVTPANQPPVVVATDGVADVGATVVLSGNVTDDGVALPLTLTWSQISGPGTATITNPAIATTTVSFDTVGTYVLQLEADDTEFQVTDTATFVVSEVNQPPTVVADDGGGPASASLALTGTVTDDGVATPLTLTWEPDLRARHGDHLRPGGRGHDRLLRPRGHLRDAPRRGRHGVHRLGYGDLHRDAGEPGARRRGRRRHRGRGPDGAADRDGDRRRGGAAAHPHVGRRSRARVRRPSPTRTPRTRPSPSTRSAPTCCSSKRTTPSSR